MRVTKWIFSGALKKYRAIEVEQVANAMRYYAAQDFKGVHAFNNDSLLAVKHQLISAYQTLLTYLAVFPSDQFFY